MIKHSWTHTKTGGQYIVLGCHWDAVKQCPRVDYQSVDTGMRYSRTWNNFKKRFTENEDSSCDYESLDEENLRLSKQYDELMGKIRRSHPNMTPSHGFDYLMDNIHADITKRDKMIEELARLNADKDSEISTLKNKLGDSNASVVRKPYTGNKEPIPMPVEEEQQLEDPDYPVESCR